MERIGREEAGGLEAALAACPLFRGMEDLDGFLAGEGVRLWRYEKSELLFEQGQIPRYLWILLGGKVEVGNYSPEGRRQVVAHFSSPGEVFGEVFFYLDRAAYEHYALCLQNVEVLALPREGAAFWPPLLGENMLRILAQKAYFLNKKLSILSGGSLRQKIARTMLAHAMEGAAMHREDLADFLGVSRPALSRVVMELLEEGALAKKGRGLAVADREALARMAQ